MIGPRLRGVTARLALLAIVACSSLGICWKELAPRGHDCCERQGSRDAPAPGCASPTLHASAVPLALPVAVVVSVPGLEPVLAPPVLRAVRSAPGTKAPPLILRI